MIEHCKLFFLKLNRARMRAQQTDNWCFSKEREIKEVMGFRTVTGNAPDKEDLRLCSSAGTSLPLNIAPIFGDYWLPITASPPVPPNSLSIKHCSFSWALWSSPCQPFSTDVPTCHQHWPWCLPQPKLRGCWHFVLCTPCSSIKPYFSTYTLATMCQPTESLQDTSCY